MTVKCEDVDGLHRCKHTDTQKHRLYLLCGKAVQQQNVRVEGGVLEVEETLGKSTNAYS